MSVKNLKLAKAENAVMAHDWRTAVRLYKELLNGNESNLEYLKAIASIYVKSGEDDKAIPYYDQIIAFYPHDVDAMNSLGGIYRRLKKFDKSIDILQRALDEGVNVTNVKYSLGFTYKEMGNYEDAIDAFESVIDKNSSDVLAYNHLGSIYFSLKDYEKSVTAFRKGLQVDPNHPILNYNLARCYEAAKNYPESINCYEAALKTRPGWIDAIKDFGELLIKCQNTRQAQEMVEQSIKLHPNDANLLSLLGKIYLHQNDYENSTDVYTKADNIKKNDIEVLTGLAQALEKSSQVEKALDKVEEAVEIEPDNKDIKKQYAHTLLSAQHYDKALDNINELYNDKGEKDLQVLDLYGQYFICRGNEEVAKFYYDKIKKINHHYKDYMLEASDRFVQTGDLDSAEKYAKEYVESRPQKTEGHTSLGKIYKAQGKLENAKNEFEKSFSDNSPNILANNEIKEINNEIENNSKKESNSEVNTDEPKIVPESFATEENTEYKKENDETEEANNDILSKFSLGSIPEDLLNDNEDEFWDDFDDNEANSNSITSSETLPKKEITSPDISTDSLEEDNDSYSSTDDDFTDLPENTIEDLNDFLESEPNYSEPEDDKYEAYFDDSDEEESNIADEEITKKEIKDTDTKEDIKDKDARRLLNNHAVEAAFNAQKLARELSEKQDKFENELRKENEQMIKDTVEKTVDEKFKSVIGDNVITKPSEDESTDDDSLDEDDNLDDKEMFDEESASIDSDDTVLDDSTLDNNDNDNMEDNVNIGNTNEASPIKEFANAHDDFLNKIERILSDPCTAYKNSNEIELFKQLRKLIKLIPEDEKSTFHSCKMRVLIEYVIAKMSGKPGLLITAESLLKSGVLGPEYDDILIYSDKTPVSNNLVLNVLSSMKNMAKDLEDKELSNAMAVDIDYILEKVELAIQQDEAIF